MKLKEVSKIAYNQWHFEKNKRLDPETISSTSREIVYWQCKKENKHIWASYVYAKVDNDIECPLCINTEVHTSGPELLSVERQFNGSRKNIYYILNTWHCKNCKNVWQTESGDTIPTNTYCTNCFGEEMLENSFAEEYPELAEEWAIDNILPATEVLSYLPLEVKWKCKICNNIWNSKVEERRFGLKSCPYCAKKLPLPGIDSFMALYPDIAEEWAYEANEMRHPDAIFPDNRLTPIVWRCKKCLTLHVASVYNKIHGTSGCKNCTSEQPISAERYMFLKSEFHSSSGDIKDFDLMIPDYTPPLKWLCKECNEIFILSLKERYYEARDCACVEGRKAIPGKTSFKALYPVMAVESSEVNEVDLDNILPTYSLPITWDCKKCAMAWKSSVKDRVAGNAICPYCSGKKAIPGKTSFKALYPEMAAEYSSNNEVSSDTILSTYSPLVEWDCPVCNMTWKGSVKDRVNEEIDCPYCNGREAIRGKTSFKALHSDMMTEWNLGNWLFIDPDDIIENYSGSVWWTCYGCQNSYAMSPKKKLYYRKRKKQPCPYCKGLRRKMHHFL